jgi:RimJ/RimL family protein N-acetyltransferase
MFHRSERLLLRPGWADDAPELSGRIADTAVLRQLARAAWPSPAEQWQAWLEQPVLAGHPRLLVTLPDQAGSAIVGACGLFPGAGAPELGYWIAREWWGRGLATEAVRAVLEIAAALGHARLRAWHSLDNPASGRVLAKTGFRQTGGNAPCASHERGATSIRREYEAVLGVQVGDNDPSGMRRAA